MRTKIFCFTGTGNSLMIAKILASELNNTEIVRISQTIKDVSDDDYPLVGLVFPVYYGGLPSLVQRFLPALKQYPESYIFGVVTYANGPGRALAQLRAELQEIDLDLSAGFRLRMPQNFIMSYDVPDDEQIAAIHARAHEQIPAIIDIIRGKKTFRHDSDFPTYSGQSTRYLNFIAQVKKTDIRFWSDESCTECGVCVRVCPVHNIVLGNGGPQWLHNCEQCLACINWCPEQAIQYGNQTSEKGRYTNPQITVKDLEF